MTTNVPESYTQDYRHFDNLIWQVPAWATAVFSFSMTAAMFVLINVTSIERILPIDALRSLSVFLFAIFIALLLLTNVFLRFRLHQRSIYRPHRLEVPSLWFMLNGQTTLLLLLFIEVSIILCFALVTAGVCLENAQVIALIFLVFGFWYVEAHIRELSTIIKANCTVKQRAISPLNVEALSKAALSKYHNLY